MRQSPWTRPIHLLSVPRHSFVIRFSDFHITPLGDDDEQLQYLLMQADEGNVDAMVTVGELLYWGSRGFTRDQVR